MLNALVNQLDQLILNDQSLNLARFEELLSLQRELGLLHGERPTCPFLRPHILSRTKYQQVTEAAQTIAGAFEKVAHESLRNPSLLRKLGLTPTEEEMARIDPGYARLCITSRLDSYLTEGDFKFLEYNAETPAGVGDQMQLEKVLFDVPATKAFLERHAHWRPQPQAQLLDALLSAYREWGGAEERPNIAIVDWEGVATSAEFRVLQNYFINEGYETIIADPHELAFEGQQLRVGNFRIDVLYKRVVIHEFLERSNRDHPVIQAYRAGRVCMVNSFRSKLAHKKAGFAILSDPKYAHLFSESELSTIQRHIPWTRSLEVTATTFEGVERELLSLVREERARFVLKPNDDYGGHGIFLGWETEADDWRRALEVAQQRPYVVQERVAVDKIHMPVFSDRVTLEEMFVDFNPFLFHNKVEGALIRLSNSSLLNVTSGGGQTALLVLED